MKSTIDSQCENLTDIALFFYHATTCIYSFFTHNISTNFSVAYIDMPTIVNYILQCDIPLNSYIYIGFVDFLYVIDQYKYLLVNNIIMQ